MVAAVYFCVPSRSIRFVNSACNFCDCCQRPPAKRISIRTTSCSPALTTVNGTPFGKIVRTGGRIWKFFRACISGCIVRSINQLLFFKNSSACFRSCGVSIPIVSTSLMPTFILYPFSSQRNCSSDSANSREDCGRAVISFNTSVR